MNNILITRETGLVYIGGDAVAAYLLDVVVAQGAAIFKLLAGEDETLLVGRNAFLVLDLAFDVVDGIGGLDLESDSLAREGLDEAGDAVSTVSQSSLR